MLLVRSTIFCIHTTYILSSVHALGRKDGEQLQQGHVEQEEHWAVAFLHGVLAGDKPWTASDVLVLIIIGMEHENMLRRLIWVVTACYLHIILWYPLLKCS